MFTCTSWKVSKYGVFSGPYFSVLGLNTGKYGPEKTPYLDTFHAVLGSKHVSQSNQLFELTSKPFYKGPTLSTQQI